MNDHQAERIVSALNSIASTSLIIMGATALITGFLFSITIRMPTKQKPVPTTKPVIESITAYDSEKVHYDGEALWKLEWHLESRTETHDIWVTEDKTSKMRVTIKKEDK